MSLCIRCEHRFKYLDALIKGEKYRPRPRCECGDIETSKISCYMFKPGRAVVLKKSNGNDPRSPFDPPMIAARSEFVRPAIGHYEMNKTHDGYVFYFVPDMNP